MKKIEDNISFSILEYLECRLNEAIKWEIDKEILNMLTDQANEEIKRIERYDNIKMLVSYIKRN